MAKKSTTTRPGRTDPVQWAIAAASILLVTAVFAYLTWQAIFRHDVPPFITAEIVAVDDSAGVHLATFRAHNAGTRAAAQVGIEGELIAGDSVVETATATLDYLAAGGTRGGALFFHAPIGQGRRVRVRALGYADP